MTDNEPKEIMSQEEIDAYIASVRAKENEEQIAQNTMANEPVEKETVEPVASKNENAPTPDDSDEPKEIMSQEEIDAYIASVRAKEESETQKEAASHPPAPFTEPQNNQTTPKSNGNVSQNDIDGMLRQNQEQPETVSASEHENEATDVSQKEIDEMISLENQEQLAPENSSEIQNPSEEVSQNDIDAMLQQKAESQAIEAASNTNSPEVSQEDIDALLNEQQNLKFQQPGPDQNSSSAVSQKDIDFLISQQQGGGESDSQECHQQTQADEIIQQKAPETTRENSKDVWADLNRDILSQNEIDALMSGFNSDVPIMEPEMEPTALDQSARHAGSEKSIAVISPKSNLERLRDKEENYIQKRAQASKLLKNMLRAEDDRLTRLLTLKGKMTDEEMYGRYEITRADRTKVVVSMSKQNARQYKLSRPGCCMHRI